MVAFVTYNKLRKAKVAHLDVVVCIDQHIVTLDVAMDNAKLVHVKEHSSTVECNFYFELHRDVFVALYMKQGEQALINELVNDYYVWDSGTAAHEESNVRVTKNALHDDLILNFCK